MCVKKKFRIYNFCVVLIANKSLKISLFLLSFNGEVTKCACVANLYECKEEENMYDEVEKNTKDQVKHKIKKLKIQHTKKKLSWRLLTFDHWNYISKFAMCTFLK